MSVVTHPVLSPAEFAATMDNVGWSVPVELISGEVVYIAPAGGSHSLAQTEIVHGLRAWQREPRGRVLTDVLVRIGDAYLAPDVAWWSAGREPAIARGALTTVPDLVAEVLSPLTRDNDLGPKRSSYLKAGVGELWLVDPDARTVLVVDASGETLLTEADAIGSPALPGFSLPLSALFA